MSLVSYYTPRIMLLLVWRKPSTSTIKVYMVPHPQPPLLSRNGYSGLYKQNSAPKARCFVCIKLLACKLGALAATPESAALDFSVVALGAGPHLAEHVPLAGVVPDERFHAADYLLGDYLDVLLFVTR